MMSIFDPSSLNYSFSYKWVSSLSFFLFMSGSFWVVDSSVKLFLTSISKGLSLSLKGMFFDWKQHSLLLLSLFVMIFFFNLTGLLPFSFSNSAHLLWGVTICLPMWAAGVIFMTSNSIEWTLAHFLPTGAPIGLSPFLVAVEVISLSIRPLSLSVRLMANITAGHMILSLVESILQSSTFLSFLCMPLMLSFIMFELGVAFIQAYVFMSLISLYWEESEPDL
nr:ATP synthase protein 6 [Polyplax reclinata]